MNAALKAEDGEGTGVSGEYTPPDAAKAIQIYDGQIKPLKVKLDTIKGDMSQPWGDLKKFGHISKKDFNYVQGLVDEEDDAKRDHRLLGLAALLKGRGLFMPRDLVSMADGNAETDIVPTGERARPNLVAVGGEDELQAAE